MGNFATISLKLFSKEKEIYEEIKKTSIEVRTLNVKLDTEHVVRPEKVSGMRNMQLGRRR